MNNKDFEKYEIKFDSEKELDSYNLKTPEFRNVNLCKSIKYGVNECCPSYSVEHENICIERSHSLINIPEVINITGIHFYDDIKKLIEEYLDKYHMTVNSLARSSCIDVAYIWRLKSGEKKSPKRDVLIKLALGFKLTIDDTNALLKAGCFYPLYSETNKRDFLLHHSVENRLDVYETDDLLINLGEYSILG